VIILIKNYGVKRQVKQSFYESNSPFIKLPNLVYWC